MRIRTTLTTMLYDMLAVLISLPIALFLRVGNNVTDYTEILVLSSPMYLVICFIIFSYFKIPLRVWKYTSTEDLTAIIKAVTLSTLIFVPIIFGYNRLEGMPRSLMVINWFILIMLLGTPRFLYRMMLEKTLYINIYSGSVLRKINVLLAGATDHSEQFLRSIVNDKNSEYRIVGIIDEDKDKLGKYIRNIKVYSSLKALDQTIEQLEKKNKTPQKIIIAPNTYSGDNIQKILKFAEKNGITTSLLRRMTDFTETQAAPPLRNIQLEDLLGRPQTILDKDSMRKLIEGKRVLVTGAGGSIGAELCRQVSNLCPTHLCLLDSSEYNLYKIDLEIQNTYSEFSHSTVIADVRDCNNLKYIFEREMPHIVFHAAALKHVPMSEINACEAILTNTYGSKNVADVSINAGVEQMIMISTDKAVNPTNVMGASKRLAESYVQAVGKSKKTKRTKFVTIRFGNVLGSTGSVIPLFKQQIARGGPVTVTHPDIKRYFMTIREAVELVIQAGAITMNEPLGNSKIFVLDMGEPVLINSLARQLIRLSGLSPDKDIEIEYTGLRPGEKLFEELFHDSETPEKTENERILLAHPREESLESVRKTLKKLEVIAVKHDDHKAIELLHSVLPEYT